MPGQSDTLRLPSPNNRGPELTTTPDPQRIRRGAARTDYCPPLRTAAWGSGSYSLVSYYVLECFDIGHAQMVSLIKVSLLGFGTGAEQ